MDKVKSALVFHHFWVDKMVFIMNPLYNKVSEKPNINCKFNVSYEISEDSPDQILVAIGCELFDEQFSESNSPYYLNVIVNGQFGSEDNLKEVTDDVMEKILKANTVAILFPYVRSIVTTITATANVPPVILPPINTYKMLEDSERANKL